MHFFVDVNMYKVGGFDGCASCWCLRNNLINTTLIDHGVLGGCGLQVQPCGSGLKGIAG